MVHIGYTHYWYTYKKELKLESWKKMANDVRHLLANLPERSLSAGGYHSDDPLKLDDDESVVDDETIRFNGVGELGHETFLLERKVNLRTSFTGAKEQHFAFCKTARKPYDLPVQVCLILYQFYFKGSVSISSDGDAEEWETAIQLANKLFGLKTTFKRRNNGSYLSVKSEKNTPKIQMDDHLGPERGTVI